MHSLYNSGEHNILLYSLESWLLELCALLQYSPIFPCVLQLHSRAILVKQITLKMVSLGIVWIFIVKT